MQYFYALTALIFYCVFIKFIAKTIQKIGKAREVKIYRIKYIIKTINIAFTIVFAIIVSLILGIEYTVFISSVFAVLGVALFAQWSILSNITASLIIFFSFPYRVGDRIRVIDKEENVVGEIEEISLFHVMIRVDGDLLTYPNNLILQKPVIKLKKATTAKETSGISTQQERK